MSDHGSIQNAVLSARPNGMPIALEPAGGVASKAPARPCCSACARRAVCMPVELRPEELARLDETVRETRTVRRGELLFRAAARFHHFYAIRVGSFKSVILHRDGLEQINSFFVAGEMLGLDGVHTGSHAVDMVALEDSTVCVIPYAMLESLCRESRVLQRHVLRAMSAEIVREGRQLMSLGTMRAEQRVAAFLLDLSERVSQCGYSRHELELRMDRGEIGNYLGLKLETVSRMLSKLTRQGLIDTRAKQIRIVDFEGLARI